MRVASAAAAAAAAAAGSAVSSPCYCDTAAADKNEQRKQSVYYSNHLANNTETDTANTKQ